MAKLFYSACGDCFNRRELEEQESDELGGACSPEELCLFKGLKSQSNEPVNTLMSLDTNEVLLGTAAGELQSFDPKTGNIKTQWNGHRKSITKVAKSSESGQFLYTSSRDQTVNMWDAKPGSKEPKQTFRGHHELVVSCVACKPNDDSIICTGSRDNSLALWDVSSASVISSSKIARNLVTDICWKGTILAQTSEDKCLRLWDSRNLEVNHEFSRGHQILTSCDIKEDIILTSSGGINNTGCLLSVWDSRFGTKPVFELRGHEEKVSQCRFIEPEESHQSLAVSVSADHSVKIWNLQKQALLCSLSLAEQPVSLTQITAKSSKELGFAVGCFTGAVVVVAFDLVKNKWTVH